MHKTAHQNEEDILKKAANHVKYTRYLHEFTDGILYKMEQCYLAGYMQAQADIPHQWEAGYNEALRISEHRIHALQNKLIEIIKTEIFNCEPKKES